ncbi:MAG TPA: hypothetical protein VKK79_02445 [Candidatus Lokiarchaeia archaeon]|nr:hypothetical protein [Candidatus Lokiarchaeia archaeon]
MQRAGAKIHNLVERVVFHLQVHHHAAKGGGVQNIGQGWRVRVIGNRVPFIARRIIYFGVFHGTLPHGVIVPQKNFDNFSSETPHFTLASLDPPKPFPPAATILGSARRGGDIVGG